MNVSFLLIVAFASSAMCLEASTFEATRLSLPSEGLSLQSFDLYPKKKGKWYTENIEEGRFEAEPSAAFRTEMGLLIRGRTTGPKPVFIIPLNPEGASSRLTHLREHRLRFMIRSNRRGVVRVMMKNRERKVAKLPWQPFSQTSVKSMTEKNSKPFITHTWASHWQHLEMPVFRQGAELDGEEAVLNWGDHWIPSALEFRFSSEEGEVELHLDEVMMDTGTMVSPLNRGIAISEIQNIWPNRLYPVPGWTYRPWEGWEPRWSHDGGINLLKAGALPDEGWELVFKEGGEASLGETVLSLRPSHPIRIATADGVKRIHMSLSSSGVSGYALRLTLREEKVRDSKKASFDLNERHEHFVTHLPLDFRGRRGFDLPLNFIGFPNREDHRAHNKKVDGFLELVSIEVVRRGRSMQGKNTRHRLVFWPVKQWTDKRDWEENFSVWDSSVGDSPQLPSQLRVKKRGVVLRDMESICWNSRVIKGEDTGSPLLTQAERSAFRGNYGLQLTLPRKEIGVRGRVEAQIFFNQIKTSSFDRTGLGEHQLEVRLRATHRGRVKIMLKDAKGNIWSSPAESFGSSQLDKEIPDSHQIVTFDAFRGKARNYRDEKGRRGSLAELPLKLYGFHFLMENVKVEGWVDLDDLTLYEAESSEELRPMGLKRWTSAPVQEMVSGNIISAPWFSSEDGWYLKEKDEEGSEVGKARSEVKLNYTNALKKYEQLRELDANSQKSLGDFFDVETRIPQVVKGPGIRSVKICKEGIFLDVEWLTQKEPPKWLQWAVQSVALARITPSQWNDRVLPMNRGILGLQFEWETSGFPGSFFELSFEDDGGHIYRHRISLEEKGAFCQGVGFKPSYFQIENSKRDRVFPTRPSGNLRLKDVVLGLGVDQEGVSGRQSLRLGVPELIVDREAEFSLVRQ